MTAPTRPVLRYHGGKWKLAPWICEHMPPHRIYVEPFGGAASVLLRKRRSYAEIYNDLDGEVVDLFRVLRDPANADRLRTAVACTPFSRSEFEASYEPTDEPIERSRRLIVRAFMGFGSNAVTTEHGRTGFRSGAFRQGTVPAMDWTTWPDQVPSFVERLRGVLIEERPAAEVIIRYDSDDTLHYVDPPYVHSTRSRSGGYRHEMTDSDHRALAEVLRSVSGMVVLSGYPCALYDQDLYPDWQRIERTAMADGARERTEVLWINPAASDRMDAQMNFMRSMTEVTP